ncbi:hypothetical protein SETIT_5G221800v2 [Setaria italica]|uniref:Uncharacterized protein n=1 Tax=Setaria italica TaxID=4555 RepID=K3XMA5_SETIT|nr:uncharacterized protein LOC101764917 [Setaria italica]RCV26142.1 hypothetical protein SETIT_5G221800v2 [Setaria italica]
MAANSAETERALEQCERDLDLAIERLVNLRLDPEHDAGEGAAPDIIDDDVRHAPAPAAAKARSAAPVPSGGSGHAAWIERLINEMLSAADVEDARARAATFLNDFDASVAVGRDVVALQENRVLKKAVLLQHRLDNKKETANRELQRQLAGCQERVRSLETDSYALSMFLRRAQPQGGPSMTGRFHPEVF